MFADVTFSTEGIAVITILMAGLVTAVTYLFRLLIAAKDGELASKDTILQEMFTKNRILTGIAQEAVGKLAVVAARTGHMPAALVPVKAEHGSESTPQQEETARLATMRAKLVAASLALDLPAEAETDPCEQQKKIAKLECPPSCSEKAP